MLSVDFANERSIMILPSQGKKKIMSFQPATVYVGLGCMVSPGLYGHVGVGIVRRGWYMFKGYTNVQRLYQCSEVMQVFRVGIVWYVGLAD